MSRNVTKVTDLCLIPGKCLEALQARLAEASLSGKILEMVGQEIGFGWEEMGLKTQWTEHRPLCLEEKQGKHFNVMPPAPPINAVSVCSLLVCISFIGRQNGTFVPESKEIVKAHILSSDLMSTMCMCPFYFQTNKSSP